VRRTAQHAPAKRTLYPPCRAARLGVERQQCTAAGVSLAVGRHRTMVNHLFVKLQQNRGGPAKGRYILRRTISASISQVFKQRMLSRAAALARRRALASLVDTPSSRGLALVRRRRPEPSNGAVVPADEWKAVQDNAGVYWWNPRTNQTTAVGAPRPGTGLPAVAASSPPGSVARTVVELMSWGAGVTLAFAAVRAVLG